METYSHFPKESFGTEGSYQCDSGQHLIQNFIDSTAEDFAWFFYSRMDQVLIGIVMPVILFLGVTGNGLFIFATFRVQSMRTITNFYLVNLAIADACYLASGIGEKLACLYTSTVHSDVNVFGVAWCAAIFPLVRMCAFASLFFVTIVTVDKYYAICWPLQHRIRTSPGRSHTKYVILITWVVAFCLAAITVPASSNFITYCVVYPEESYYSKHPDIVSFCYPVNNWVSIMVNGIQTLPIFFALVPNFYMYFQIIRKLNDRLAGSDIPQFVQNGIKIRNAVAKMLVLNGLVFFLCNMPFSIVSLMYMVLAFVDSETRKHWQTALQPVTPYAQLLLYVNSAVNPYIYNTVNKAYRRALCKALCFGALTSKADTPRGYSAVRTATTEDTHL